MDGKRLIEKIKLRNILSFGDKGEEIELQPLNIIIGQNASGKSNLVDIFQLLQSAANGYFSRLIQNNGGVNEYLWKGNYNFPIAEINVILIYKQIRKDFVSYSLKFAKVAQGLEIVEEEINPIEPISRDDFYYRSHNKQSNLVLRQRISEETEVFTIKPNILSQDELQHSILSRLDKKYTGFKVLNKISEDFSNIAIYTDWHFSRSSPPRTPIELNTRTNFLSEDGYNLALIIDEFRHNTYVYEKVIENLRKVYSRVEKLKTIEQGSKIQLYIQEQGVEELISAYRLSNGTLRYLCLLAILCHPEPPPLICIEEPETGLHPDILPTIAELMKEASQRTQLIVTTHSDILVSAFSDMPEAVLVCEKDKDGTHFKRLEKDKLKEWLDEYSLGDLWLKGEIGGTRW